MHFENCHHYSDTIAIEFFFYTGGNCNLLTRILQLFIKSRFAHTHPHRHNDEATPNEQEEKIVRAAVALWLARLQSGLRWRMAAQWPHCRASGEARAGATATAAGVTGPEQMCMRVERLQLSNKLPRRIRTAQLLPRLLH